MSLNAISPATPAAVSPQQGAIPVDRSGETVKGVAEKAVHAAHHAHAHNHPQIATTATPSTGLNTVA